MSISIPCPNCGKRPVEEFAYGEVIAVPDSVVGEDEIDLDRAFMRNNPEGEQREAWFHTYGCRRWVYVRRDTVTDNLVVLDP